VIIPRVHKIGGFEVRRALPAGQRQMIGPFIYFDQMGPGEFLVGQGLDVRPHSHIGLSTSPRPRSRSCVWTSRRRRRAGSPFQPHEGGPLAAPAPRRDGALPAWRMPALLPFPRLAANAICA
jgi:hypothetical protein